MTQVPKDLSGKTLKVGQTVAYSFYNELQLGTIGDFIENYVIIDIGTRQEIVREHGEVSIVEPEYNSDVDPFEYASPSPTVTKTTNCKLVFRGKAQPLPIDEDNDHDTGC